MFLDPLYFVIVGPAMLFAMWASWKTKSQFERYARVMASSRMTGAQAARHMLDASGLYDVQVEETQGFLSDHYDPRDRTLRLSPAVFRQPSLSAVGVACHEAGHALQHANNYVPLQLRSTLVPATQFGSKLSMPLIFIGLLMGATGGGRMLLLAGVAMFTLTVLFSLVTLPVEYDASARAKRHMVAAGIIQPSEQEAAGRVLDAAFLTYVAATISSLLTLLYFLMRAGLLGRSND